MQSSNNSNKSQAGHFGRLSRYPKEAREKKQTHLSHQSQMFRDNTPPVIHVAMYPPSHSVHTQSHSPSQPLSPFSHSVHSAIQSTHIAPTHSTAKRRIHREKASPRHSLKPPQGPHRPLLISQGRPLLGDPVPHRPVIPRRQEHPPRPT